MSLRTLRERNCGKECVVLVEDVMKSQFKKSSKKNKAKVAKDVGPLCPTFDKEEWENDFAAFPEGLGGTDHVDPLVMLQESEQFRHISEECECEVEQELTKNILCRQDEIRRILGLIGQCKNQLPQSIFIYGHSGTGKSFVLQNILDKLKYRHVVIDCVQCYMPKLLYMSILNTVAEHHMTVDNNYEPYASCDNILDFTLNLKAAMKCNSFIIVLDKCERLRDMSKTILPAFNRLKQLTGLNVCVIFLSNIIPEKFHSAKGYFETIPVHFKQYTKDEIFQILSVNHPWTEKESLYKNYLKLFLGVFYGSCRDLCELKYMVNSNFFKHSQSMVAGTSEMHKLWQVVVPHLKSSLEYLYQRTAMWMEYENDFSLAGNTAANRGLGYRDQMSSQEFALSFELPYYTKYFLIAAYLASYIPSKLDKALFMKRKDKKKKKRINRSKNDILSDMLLGPKPFTVDRLLAIFYSIVQDEVSFTVNLSVQISSLVKLRLLIMVNSNIDCPKYKCAVGLDFIKIIARTVNFDIVKYLFPSN
ncbi:origin recognition complex subunit 5 isoform X1 [Schistocerca nitens]|uniref:origin recognition complex subunit 5 isoform X1 n=2 Tax=Schistocerca nitens TaxID=7011 RepID=UPI0021177C7D|nr:origin recognition complex subunit 5 isoform X1 [Schistocerca nitens]